MALVNKYNLLFKALPKTYRNISKNFKFSIKNNIAIFVGPNNIGKTNLLNSIWEAVANEKRYFDIEIESSETVEIDSDLGKSLFGKDYDLMFVDSSKQEKWFPIHPYNILTIYDEDVNRKNVKKYMKTFINLSIELMMNDKKEFYQQKSAVGNKYVIKSFSKQTTNDLLGSWFSKRFIEDISTFNLLNDEFKLELEYKYDEENDEFEPQILVRELITNKLATIENVSPGARKDLLLSLKLSLASTVSALQNNIYTKMYTKHTFVIFDEIESLIDHKKVKLFLSKIKLLKEYAHKTYFIITTHSSQVLTTFSEFYESIYKLSKDKHGKLIVKGNITKNGWELYKEMIVDRFISANQDLMIKSINNKNASENLSIKSNMEFLNFLIKNDLNDYFVNKKMDRPSWIKYKVNLVDRFMTINKGKLRKNTKIKSSNIGKYFNILKLSDFDWILRSWLNETNCDIFFYDEIVYVEGSSEKNLFSVANEINWWFSMSGTGLVTMNGAFNVFICMYIVSKLNIKNNTFILDADFKEKSSKQKIIFKYENDIKIKEKTVTKAIGNFFCTNEIRNYFGKNNYKFKFLFNDLESYLLEDVDHEIETSQKEYNILNYMEVKNRHGQLVKKSISDKYKFGEKKINDLLSLLEDDC